MSEDEKDCIKVKRDEVIVFCAKLLGIEVETLRAWLARMEEHQHE